MKKSIVKRFLREESGTAYIMACIAVVPMFGFAALAVDYSNIDRAKTDLETTTQMVALHVAKRVALNPDMAAADLIAEGRALINSVTNLTVSTDPQDGGKFTVDMTSGKVQIVAKTDIDTHFMHMFGYDVVSPTVRTQAQFGRRNVEVAIAIDNSGSMGNSGGVDADGNNLTKIQAAKQAAYALIDSASAAVSSQVNATVKFSIVPWNNMVSLPNDEMRSGASASAAVTAGTWEEWIDWEGYSTIHFNALAPFKLNQGDMYYDMFDNCSENCDEWKHYDPAKLVDYLKADGVLESDDNGINVDALKAKPDIGVVTRFDVFEDTNTVFGGCFEHRAGDYRFKFDAPTTSNFSNPSLDPDFDGDSLYVPVMSPDEDDTEDGYSDILGYTTDTTTIKNNIFSGANSYVNDQGGMSDHQQGQTGSGNSDDADLDNSELARTYNTAKYYNMASHDLNTSSSRNPNGECDIASLLPLNDDIAGLTAATAGQNGDIKQAIDAMYAGGNTDVTLGLLWGMNTLTPWEPVESGGSFDDAQKVLVVITDGDNVPRNSTQRDYSYGSLQYPKDDPFDLIDGSVSSSTATDMFDEGTKAICTEIKNMGVTVYFVSFDNVSTRSTALSNHCASRSDTAVSASNTQELIAAFEKIGDDIGKLRLTAFDD